MRDLTLVLDHLRNGAIAIERELSAEELELTDDEFRFPAPIAAGLKARLEAGEVRLTGTLRTQIETDCARCLEPATMAFEAPVDEVWAKADPLEGADPEQIDDLPITNLLEGDEVDVSQALREVVLAELPERVLCKPDCKGLCPRCGENLNVGPCSCPADAAEDLTPEWQRSLQRLRLENK